MTTAATTTSATSETTHRKLDPMSTNAINDWAGPRASGPVDPYSANSAADELEVADPAAFADAERFGGPAPKLFENGSRDVPAVTASGVDPTFIGWLPVGVRHHAADLATEAEVRALFQQVAGTLNARIDHPDRLAAVSRLSTWATLEQSGARASATAATQPKAQPIRPAQRAWATTTDTPAALMAMAGAGKSRRRSRRNGARRR